MGDKITPIKMLKETMLINLLYTILLIISI